MGKVTSSTLIALLVLAGLSSCRAEEAPVSVVSLRESLSDLEDAARPWSPDAYLANAELPIHYGSPGPWLVSAGFNSTTEQFQSLLVFLREDGTVDTEIIPHTVPVVQVVPIVWRLVLSDCLDPWVGQTTEIDAITGEVISRKMHSPPAP